MCQECDDLQTQIMRYRALLSSGFDILTVERVNELVADLERRKEALHIGPHRRTSLIVRAAR
jgi:hypothetical protein